MMMEIAEAAAAEAQPKLNTSEIEQLVSIAGNAETLAQGILKIYQPSLEQIKNEVDELLKKQNNLVGKMQVENQQLRETAEDGQCCEMYAVIKAYQEKLFNIKKEMANVHERTMKLKKRALRIQQIKQKEASMEQKEEVSQREQVSIRESPSA